MSKFPDAWLAAAAACLLSVSAASAQVEAGAKAFAKCGACHAVGEGAANKVGPQLNDLIGRVAGTVEGYKYSPAMIAAGEGGLTWDHDSLAGFLADPRGFLKGTRMAFAGMKKEAELEAIIAYLATFSQAAEGAPEQSAAPEAAEAAVPTPPEAKAATAAVAVTQEPGAGANLQLGRLATEEEVAAWDIDVRPDGLGLPEGSGTVNEGMAVYDEACASCHGDFGEAIGRWPVLAGGQGTLTADRPEKTIGSYWPYLSTVFDYVHRAMPFGNARSLSNDDVYAVTAYLLYLNDIITDEEFELSRENFASVRLPNEEGFVPDDREEEPHYAKKEEPCMSDCRPGKAEISAHAAVLDVTPEDSGEDEAPAAGID